MARKEIISAKVATILDDSQIALNKGTQDGILIGDAVSLFRSVEIIDPDTKQSLGTVSLHKLNLRVNFVASAYSVARVTDRVPAPVGKPLVAQPLKAITGDLFIDTNDRTQVQVTVGERAVVYRDVKDEAPF